jgi:xylulokinase
VTVGIDIGTTSVKAIAADATGRVLARSRVPHQVAVPSPGRLEHDARAAWRDGPRQALAAVVGQLGGPSSLVAAAVSALAPTLAPVDEAGSPLGPGVLYDDDRGRPDGLDPTRSREAAELLGWAASTFPGAASFWPAQAVANRALGGPAAIDLATAFSVGPLLAADGWDAPRCTALGINSAQLPSVVMFGQAIGHLDPTLVPFDSAAAGGGTGVRPQLVAGGVDAFCEQLVAGELSVGDVLVVCGSTLVVWVVTKEDPSSAPLETVGASDGLWRLPDLTPGRVMVGGPSNAGGLFLDWVDRLFRPAVLDGRAPLDPAAIPLWQPYLRGERVPLHDRSLRGAVAGLDLTQGPDELRRAAFEASAMALRGIVERAGGEPSRIVVTGGGARVPGWLQAIADVTAVTVEPVGVPEGAALGAAWLARMGAGLETSIEDASRWASAGPVVEPDAAWVGACAERYARHRATASGGG